MSTSALHPPNIYRFRDDVIGKVNLRAGPPSHALSTLIIDFNEEVTTNVTAQSKYIRSNAKSPASKSALPSNDPALAFGDEHSNDFDPHTRVRKNATHTMCKPLSKRITRGLDEQDDADLKRQRQRLRRRTNMQRFRNNLHNRIVTFEEDINLLRENIQTLQLQRDIILSSVRESTMWSVAAEYFRLFRYGLKEGISSSEQISTTEYSSYGEANAQRGFIHANVASDVVSATGYGAAAMLESLQKLALYLPSLSTQLVRLETSARNSIIATTSVEVTITENVVRLVFPHLVRNEKWTPVAVKLLHQQFSMRGTTYFVWDNETSRIALLQSKSDLLTPMLKLLGNLETVASVFDGARITPECAIALRD